jgi:hypothetical protein
MKTKTEKQILAEIARLQAQLAEVQKPKMKKVRPLFSDKDIWIPVDTPYCCDPSTETYWCM